ALVLDAAAQRRRAREHDVAEVHLAAREETGCAPRPCEAGVAQLEHHELVAAARDEREREAAEGTARPRALLVSQDLDALEPAALRVDDAREHARGERRGVRRGRA